MNRRHLLKQLAALAALSSLGAVSYAQRAAGPAFQTLPAKVSTEAAGKVEVIEFFSYGCPHCHDFEPLLNDWAKRLAGDVNFIKVPITFNREQWTVLARAYYTLEALGEVGKHHGAAFAALHERRIPLYQEDKLFEWAAGQGIDRKRFTDAYKSFGVQSRVQRANQIAAAYKVSGVPLMAVDGRYLVSASTAGGYDQMLKAVDELIVRARSEKGRG